MFAAFAPRWLARLVDGPGCGGFAITLGQSPLSTPIDRVRSTRSRRLLRPSVREDAPAAQTRLGDDDAPLLRQSDEVPEYQRIAPGKRLFRVANSVIFVAVGIVHQQRPHAVWPELDRKSPILFPVAMIVAANLRPRRIN